MKHWKKILTSFITILLIVAGYIVYTFHFKEYDVADTEVTEITKESYKLELPDGLVFELTEEGNIVDSEQNGSGTSDSATTGETSIVGTVSSGSTSSKSSGLGSDDTREDTSGYETSKNIDSTGSSKKETTPVSKPTEHITIASIKQKYTPVLNSLQVQANDRINALVGRAKEEYRNKKEDGESINYAYFYNKYSSAAAELEGKTDSVFLQIVTIIEKDLVANGHSKKHAQTFVNDYEAAKEARKSALLDKAMNR